jgi:hypothetical protein
MNENGVGWECVTYWGERRRLMVLGGNLKKWGDLKN